MTLAYQFGLVLAIRGFEARPGRMTMRPYESNVECHHIDSMCLAGFPFFLPNVQ